MANVEKNMAKKETMETHIKNLQTSMATNAKNMDTRLENVEKNM